MEMMEIFAVKTSCYTVLNHTLSYHRVKHVVCIILCLAVTQCGQLRGFPFAILGGGICCMGAKNFFLPPQAKIFFLFPLWTRETRAEIFLSASMSKDFFKTIYPPTVLNQPDFQYPGPSSSSSYDIPPFKSENLHCCEV